MDDPFRFADELGPLKLVHIWRPAVGLKAIVAVDNIACGPAIGGVRLAQDVSTEEVGAILFGVGWGLVGYCPGPALAALGLGNPATILFVGSMLVGMGAYSTLQSLLSPQVKHA